MRLHLILCYALRLVNEVIDVCMCISTFFVCYFHALTHLNSIKCRKIVVRFETYAVLSSLGCILGCSLSGEHNCIQMRTINWFELQIRSRRNKLILFLFNNKAVFTPIFSTPLMEFTFNGIRESLTFYTWITAIYP